MSLVQTMQLGEEVCSASPSNFTESVDPQETVPRFGVFRGMAYALVFELMVVMSCYTAWLFFSNWRHH